MLAVVIEETLTGWTFECPDWLFHTIVLTVVLPTIGWLLWLQFAPIRPPRK